MFAPNVSSIAAATGVNTATWTGPTRTLAYGNADGYASASAVLLWKLTQAGGVTAPTCTLYIEVSADAVTWYRIPITGAATDADETLSGVVEIGVMTKYARAYAVLGGATPPTCAITVQLASSAPITVS